MADVSEHGADHDDLLANLTGQDVAVQGNAVHVRWRQAATARAWPCPTRGTNAMERRLRKKMSYLSRTGTQRAKPG